MIVKILSSARNFEGIDYSERKNELGKSQLLKAENFNALGNSREELSKADYINYMKLVCDSNPRVKNRQFHAVLSVKGNSHSSLELAKIAGQYLKSMGYGDNPYLIYFHADTNNNHVHMVSTRVDKNGNKVDDTYEKIRSQKVLQEILNQDPHLEVKSAIENALAFNFSTKAQFKLLLEEQGFRFAEKEGQLKLIKYGRVQTELNESIIKSKIQNYQDPKDRIQQLKAIFHRYKQGMELEKFMEILNRKFGLKLILHQHSEHSTPYGYTIIDYNKKQVLKGSQIMPLKQLLMPINEEEKKQLLNRILDKLDYSTYTFHKMKMELSKYGFDVTNEGVIRFENGQTIGEKIGQTNLQQLKYNGRVRMANQFNIDSEAEKSVLAKLFQVRMEDLVGASKTNKEIKNYYSSILQNLDQRYGVDEFLNSNKLEILKYQNSYYLLDRAKRYLFDIDILTQHQKIDFKNVKVHHLDKTTNQEISHHQHTNNPIGQLAQLLELSINESNHQSPRRKKRKRRQI